MQETMRELFEMVENLYIQNIKGITIEPDYSENVTLYKFKNGYYSFSIIRLHTISTNDDPAILENEYAYDFTNHGRNTYKLSTEEAYEMIYDLISYSTKERSL